MRYETLHVWRWSFVGVAPEKTTFFLPALYAIGKTLALLAYGTGKQKNVWRKRHSLTGSSFSKYASHTGTVAVRYSVRVAEEKSWAYATLLSLARISSAAQHC